MAYTLHGLGGSPNSAAAIGLLKHLGIEYTMNNVDFKNGKHKEEPVISANPLG